MYRMPTHAPHIFLFPNAEISFTNVQCFFNKQGSLISFHTCFFDNCYLVAPYLRERKFMKIGSVTITVVKNLLAVFIDCPIIELPGKFHFFYIAYEILSHEIRIFSVIKPYNITVRIVQKITDLGFVFFGR